MGEVKMKALKWLIEIVQALVKEHFIILFVTNSLQTQLTNKGVNNEKGLLMVSLKDS